MKKSELSKSAPNDFQVCFHFYSHLPQFARVSVPAAPNLVPIPCRVPVLHDDSFVLPPSPTTSWMTDVVPVRRMSDAPHRYELEERGEESRIMSVPMVYASSCPIAGPFGLAAGSEMERGRMRQGRTILGMLTDRIGEENRRLSGENVSAVARMGQMQMMHRRSEDELIFPISLSENGASMDAFSESEHDL